MKRKQDKVLHGQKRSRRVEKTNSSPEAGRIKRRITHLEQYLVHKVL